MTSKIKTKNKANSAFYNDVINGLSLPQKYISSKYFYDAKGDALFQQIMKLPEYYLTSSETEILQTQSAHIFELIDSEKLHIIELGAGDGTKTVNLLKKGVESGKKITYIPIDISPNALEINRLNIKNELPEIPISQLIGDYFQALSQYQRTPNIPVLILFMGSNIGNFTREQAAQFLTKLKSLTQQGDYFMVGIDLKKNPKTILAAYNDKQGVTKEFNINLLRRINRELGANILIENFDHYPTYNPLTGTTLSFIVSLVDQTIQIDQYKLYLHKGEPIHTEISQKYSKQQINHLAETALLKPIHTFLDKKEYYTLNLFSY